MLKTRLTALALSVTFALCSAAAVSAQPPPATETHASFAVTLRDPQGRPVAGAVCRADAPGITRRTTSDAQGRCTFSSIPAGVYTLNVSALGFIPESVAGVEAAATPSAPLLVALQQTTLRSLRVITHIYTRAGEALNTSPVAVSTITNSAILKTGDPNPLMALQTQPGVQVALVNAHGENAFNTGSAIVRGGAAWETAQLVDGHPLPINVSGRFPTSNLDGFFFDSIEVTKGPGAISPVVNNAINGTINFRLLEPTATASGQVVQSYDGWGGMGTHARLSGPLGSRLSYAVAYGSVGSRGYTNGTHLVPYPIMSGEINGQPIAINPTTGGPMAPGINNPYAKTTLIGDGGYLTGDYGQHSGLARLRYDFNPSSSLMFTYFGDGFRSQYLQAIGATSLFDPGPSYSGSLPAGRSMYMDIGSFNSPYPSYGSLGLEQLDFRTRIGADTLLGRYYFFMSKAWEALLGGSGPTGADYTSQFPIYGTAYLCPSGTSYYSGACNPGGIAPTLNTFNGQTVNFTTPKTEFDGFERDYLRGAGAEWDHVMGQNLFSLSFDRSDLQGYARYVYAPISLTKPYLAYPQGTGETTTSVLARAVLNPSDRLTIIPAVYYNGYTYRTSPDNGKLFGTTTLGHFDPRLGVTYQPSPNVSLRFSAGSSIAPPYISAISNARAVAPYYCPTCVSGQPIYNEITSNGQLRPENAFGYDLGGDARVANAGIIISADLYSTTLANQFFTQYVPHGTYTGTHGTFPLYLLEPANLSRARYEGIEFSIRRQPVFGWGFALQGSLQRAYPYDIPPSFYSPGAGQSPAINLAVVPNVNYQYTVATTGGTPYSQGDAEINYRFHSGIEAGFNEIYVGPNNTYNVPHLFYSNASLKVPVGKHLALQFAGMNVFNTDSGWLDPWYGPNGPYPTADITVTHTEQLWWKTLLPPASIQTQLIWRFGGTSR